MLLQFLRAFAFSTFVLVGIAWINKAVLLLDRLIGAGHAADTFWLLSLLNIPGVLRVAIPVGALIATIFVANRMVKDSEILVMQSAGTSPWRLVRPVVFFGMTAAATMALTTHFLQPMAQSRLSQEEQRLAQSLSAKFFRDGVFQHPAPGITFYIQSIDKEGVFTNAHLSDRRDKSRIITYTAAQAEFLTDQVGTKLVMVDGLIQVLKDGRLSTTHFDRLAYDISALIAPNERRLKRISALSSTDILLNLTKASKDTGQPIWTLVAELHYRLAQAFLTAGLAIIGFCCIIAGRFSRISSWRQIVLAIVLVILLRGIDSGLINAALDKQGYWALSYVAPFVSLLVGASLTIWSGRRFSAPQDIGFARRAK